MRCLQTRLHILATGLALSLTVGCATANVGHPPILSFPIADEWSQSANLGTLILQGRATLQGKPLADVEVRVVDALTGAPAPQVETLISAGSGNLISAGSGNLISSGSANLIAVGSGNMRTDGEGNFSIQVAGLTGGNVARLIVTSGDSTVTTLVTGSGSLLAKYKVQQAGATLATPINEVTTTVSHLANGSLQLSRLLKPEAAAPALANLLTALWGVAERFEQEFALETGLAERLSRETDPLTGAPRRTPESVLEAMVSNSGLRKRLLQVNRDSLGAIALSALDTNNRSPQFAAVRPALQGVRLLGAGLTASLEEAAIKVSAGSGETVQLSLTNREELIAALDSSIFKPAAGSTTAAPKQAIEQVATYDGLPRVGLGAIVRDDKGMFWLADTEDGAVNRWNPNSPSAFTYNRPGAGPRALAVSASRSVWALYGDEGRVYSLTPESSPPLASFNLPAAARPKHLAARAAGTQDQVWVSTPDAQTVTRLTNNGFAAPLDTRNADPNDASHGIRQPEGLGIDSTGGVWIVSGRDQKLLGLHSDGTWRNTIDFAGEAAVPLAHPTHLVVDSQDRVWFSDTATNHVLSIQPATGKVQVYTVPGGPGELAADGEHVWVLSAGGKSISQITPEVSSEVVTRPLDFTPGNLTCDRQSAYVTDLDHRRVVAFKVTRP